jgi:hypothetical protein
MRSRNADANHATLSSTTQRNLAGREVAWAALAVEVGRFGQI